MRSTKIPYIVWRAIGKHPNKQQLARFNPGPGMRQRGMKALDLWADGPLLTPGQCQEKGLPVDVGLRGKGSVPMTFSDVQAIADVLAGGGGNDGNAIEIKVERAEPKTTRNFENLFHEYFCSEAFAKLAPKTRQIYKSHGQFIIETWGPFLPAALTADLLETYFDRQRRRRGHNAAYKDFELIRRVLNWGQKKQHWRGALPGREDYSNLELEKPGGRLRIDYPGELEALQRAFDDPGSIYDELGIPSADRILTARPSMADALILMLWTAARVQDALKLTNRAFDGKTIVYQPAKTKKRRVIVSIPVMPLLAERLEKAETRRIKVLNEAARFAGACLVINEETGRPYWRASKETAVVTHSQFNRHWQDYRGLAGQIVPSLVGDGVSRIGEPIPAFNAQDCRDVAVSRLADAGCDLFEIAAWHGSDADHILKLAQHYIAIGETHASRAGQKLLAMAERRGLAL